MQKRIAAIMFSMLVLVSLSAVPILANADTQFQKLSVRMRGIITQWGDDQVFGWVDAFAVKINANGTYRDRAFVHALWSYDKPRLNCTKPPTESFSFSFYIAKLVQSQIVAFNYSGYNFYISGLWNVVKFTTFVNIDANGQLINITKVIEPIVTNATGELRVLPHPPQVPARFELAIDGRPVLGGIVVMWRIMYFEIKICDLNNDDKVDLIDLIRVAKSYRAFPGHPGYIIERDFDFNYIIEIGDLTTIAANIE